MSEIDRRTALKLLGAGAAGLGGGLLAATPALGGVHRAVDALGRGEPVVVVDDADGANPGDLILAAEHATARMLAFIVRHTTGLLSVGMTAERLDALDLPLLPRRHSDGRDTAFTVSVDYRPTTTSGVSAADRAATIQALVDDATKPADFARPGHVFPLRARPGGILERAGHTEAAVDLARLAGLQPAGVLSQITNDDGTAAGRSQLTSFAARHGLVMTSIGQLIELTRVV
jgi:3,4-dihydroxy-2-butanone 4-phosphate synthase